MILGFLLLRQQPALVLIYVFPMKQQIDLYKKQHFYSKKQPKFYLSHNIQLGLQLVFLSFHPCLKMFQYNITASLCKNNMTNFYFIMEEMKET